MKTIRQQKILELIADYDIETQEDLADYLRQEGFKVTQATISRDIRELKLRKRAKNGKLVYGIGLESDDIPESRYIRVLKDSMVSMEQAMNLLVIKTSSGMAMAAAAALDACHFHEIVGCIAGDDTIMCALRSVQDAVLVKKKIERIIEA